MCLAVPGKILSIHNEQSDPLFKMGRVSFGGVVKEVSLAYVPEAQVDDYIIVHAGFALNILNREEAEKTLTYIDRIAEVTE